MMDCWIRLLTVAVLAEASIVATGAPKPYRDLALSPIPSEGEDTRHGLQASESRTVAVRLSVPPDVSKTVRRDWRFRETLPAIDDWEGICEHLVGEQGEKNWTPVIPVPYPGTRETATIWPNLIPASLIPKPETLTELHLYLAGDEQGGKTSPAAVGLDRITPDGARSHQEAPIDQLVTGYKHVGGGQRYRMFTFTRRFDRLCEFRAESAPFSLRAPTPLDLRPGPTRIPLELRSVSESQIEIDIRVAVFAPGRSRRVAVGSFSLAAGATERVAVPVTLDWEGGGLVVVTLDTEGKRYQIPFLTHVEAIAPVLDGIEKILADHPDTEAAAELRRLRSEHRDLLPAICSGNAPPGAWRTAFEAACALRRRLLMKRIDFDTLLFVKRKPFITLQPYMDAHHLYNHPGGGIYSLSPVCPEGKVRPVVDNLGEGIYRDVCLSWDATRILFSFGRGSNDWKPDEPSYDIYEVGVDGSGLKQLTFGPKNDCEPFYLPGGRIGFTSDRAEHFVLCGSDIHVALLYSMEPDGSGIVRLSTNVVNDFNPSVLPDGRIIYTRWEYNERSVTSIHSLFTMRPDGRQMAPYFGNQSIRPSVLMFPRAVPGSHKVMSLFTGHHSQTHGAIGLIDPATAVNGLDAIEILTPGMPVIAERIEDSRVGWAARLWPLSEETFLLCYTPTVQPWHEWTWAIYISDRHGNKALVYRDAEISVTEPIPLVPSRRPPVIAGPTRPGDDRSGFEDTATLVLLDAYAGQPEIEPGSVRSLRVIEDVPRKGVHKGSVIEVSATSMFTTKRIIGTVPVESDGSAYFQVPANRPVYFALIDEEGLEIQRMRSYLCLRPGEVQSCVGCHEPRHTAPPARRPRPIATGREPSIPVPPPWGLRTVSYLRDVQPVLDRHCLKCHERGRKEHKVLLSGELTDRFAVSYESLLPYIKTAYTRRWDFPADVHRVPPRTFGSGASPLMQMLKAGHNDIALDAVSWDTLATWIDANGVYYGWYQWNWPDREIFKGRKPFDEVFARRCEKCHADSGGRASICYPSINPFEPLRSRMLLAPLAAKVGGWGACGETVFRDRDDPDYRALAGALENLAAELKKRPRRDLLELREPDPAKVQAQGTGRIDGTSYVEGQGEVVQVDDIVAVDTTGDPSRDPENHP